jgi:hypothetical protein
MLMVTCSLDATRAAKRQKMALFEKKFMALSSVKFGNVAASLFLAISFSDLLQVIF